MPWTDIAIVVASLFSGFGGGLLIRLIDQRQKKREDKANRDQELKGLMTLMFTEYSHNKGLLEVLIMDPSFINARAWNNLQMEVWKESRLRLTQFITKDHIVAFNQYYGQIQTILDYIHDEQMPFDVKRDTIIDAAKRAKKYGNAAMMHCAQYIFVDDPDYTENVHNALIQQARKLCRAEGCPKDPTKDNKKAASFGAQLRRGCAAVSCLTLLRRRPSQNRRVEDPAQGVRRATRGRGERKENPAQQRTENRPQTGGRKVRPVNPDGTARFGRVVFLIVPCFP